MGELLSILVNISLPILLLIAVGYGFQKIFKTDVRTYIKLQIYLLVPGMVFIRILESAFTMDLFLTVAAYEILLTIGLYAISRAYCAIARFQRSVRNATNNAMMLINTGNYGFPLIDLVFQSSPVATASQLIIVLFQNITSSTVSIYQASAGRASRREALLSILKIPVLYAMILGAIVRLISLDIPEMIMVPLGYLNDAFIGVALISLGVQLAEVRLTQGAGRVIATSLVKIVSAPLLGFALVLLLGAKGLLAQALIVGIATPTAVTAAILAREFDNEPGYTAQVVLVTTILCTVTLPVVICFAQQYFPL
jgi:malate permease and related proteins